jgi:NAD(P)-dependent dehydrogenase (short-subunit alcohol dehydrogenase family)
VSAEVRFRFDGKVAIVSGAARGVGREIVGAFVDAGARVVAVGTESFRDPAAAGRIRHELQSLDSGQARPSDETAKVREIAAKPPISRQLRD